MNIVDTITCKKQMTWTGRITFRTNKSYKIIEANNLQIMVIDENVDRFIIYEKSKLFNDHFYSKKEIRALKLNSL